MIRVTSSAEERPAGHGVVSSRSCFVYQVVFRYDVTITVTSRRTPSTSCAYQSGKVSLSPFVKSTPYGSTLMSRLYAQSRADQSSSRLAQLQLSASGTIASASTGDAR